MLRVERAAYQLDPRRLGPRRFLGLLPPRAGACVARGARGMNRGCTLAALRRGGNALVLLGLASNTARELTVAWQELEGAHAVRSYARAVAAPDGKAVLLVGPYGCICLHRTGGEKWRRRFSEEDPILSADLLDDGSVVLRHPTQVVRLSADGSSLWQTNTPLPEPSRGYGCPVSGHSGRGLIATASGNGTQVLSLEGRPIFRAASPGHPTELAFDGSGEFLFEVSTVRTEGTDLGASHESHYHARLLSTLLSGREEWRARTRYDTASEQGEAYASRYEDMSVTSGVHVHVDAAHSVSVIEDAPYGPRILSAGTTVARRRDLWDVLLPPGSQDTALLRDASSFSLWDDQATVVVGGKDGTVRLWREGAPAVSVPCLDIPVVIARVNRRRTLVAVGYDPSKHVVYTSRCELPDISASPACNPPG